ncbi:hypothetical protein [Sphingomonas sp. CFBP 8760]|uniref:hypothetical protein n=1 Tax=Sphingomonas sp. CFBP 8760 TaxID=2775282 RepID=UPI001781EEAA|nr:hypothetical protein [Sphingomonas sp. CFBP 8760]MBD8546865.1 hypothetical protein [Sphingomonas sp. CFBP 8760]
MTIVRNCPGWAMERQEQLYRKGILPKAAFGSPQWREVEDNLQKGIAAAETTRSSHPRLCEDLPALDRSRWKRLSLILKQGSEESAGHR